VWFDKHQRDERFRALLGILEKHDPEIMAFQEVTLPFIRVLQEAEWLKQGGHWVSAVDHNNLGTVLVGRVQPQTLGWLELPTSMGRRLLVADFPGGLRVGVAHLESLANEQLRVQQLETAFAYLKATPSSVLLGDFNFPDQAPEAASLDPDFLDAWPATHPESPGYTRDTIANSMARLGREDKQERLDRILLRGLQLSQVELLGNEPLREGLYPSDHYGLLAAARLN
jgi:endonuclease/exonuclease/phosphatase family metal-dependent hydrolase